MITINKNVSLNKSNNVVSSDLGELPEGDYQLLLVVDDVYKNENKHIWFPSLMTSINSTDSFSRTEIYGEDRR